MRYAYKPEKGKLDKKGFCAYHGIEEGTEVDYIKDNFSKKLELCVDGRIGKMKWRWYKRKYHKKPKHYKKKGVSMGKNGITIKLKGGAMSGWKHYVKRGFSAHLKIRVYNQIGIFDGELDDAQFEAL